MNIMHTALDTSPESTEKDARQRATMSPEAPECFRDILVRGPVLECDAEKMALALQDAGIRVPQDATAGQQWAVARAWYDVTDEPDRKAATSRRGTLKGAAMDGIALAGLHNALIAVEQDDSDDAWENLKAAARHVNSEAKVEEFGDLLERIREMGEILEEEDGSNDEEHDAAYAVFETAETFLA